MKRSRLNLPLTHLTWTQAVPTEPGWYWHWNGDEDSAPFIFSIMGRHDIQGGCFIGAGQGGMQWGVECSKYGGWWMAIPDPNTPPNFRVRDAEAAGRVIRCADALERLLGTQSGTTRDWPIRIVADNQPATDELTAKLNDLFEALIPYRK